MLRVLVVDESEAIRKIASHILMEMGFQSSDSQSTLDALARAQSELPNIVIVDSALSGALELIRNIRMLPGGKKVHVLYSVTKADLRTLMQGKTAGANDFLLKPFDRKVFAAALSHLKVTAAA